MYKSEQQLYQQLCKLRDAFNLQGIKAEFEAEGSSFRDLMRLRRITSRAGIKLFLKIGGVEAVRDVKDAIEINVDGLIAPMVESKFGASKFYEMLRKIYGDHPVHKSLNIETKSAIAHLDEILEYSQGKFDNITIGRSDLTGSYFDADVFPDADFTFNLLIETGIKVRKAGLTFTVGGSVGAKTIQRLRNDYPQLLDIIYKLETRKIILPINDFVHKEGAIKEALKWEELYILSKKEFADVQIGSEIARLTELKRRTQ